MKEKRVFDYVKYYLMPIEKLNPKSTGALSGQKCS